METRADKLKWKRHKYNNKNRLKTQPAIWILIGFLLLACIGILSAENAGGEKDDEVKVPTINEEDVGNVQRYGYQGMGTTHEQMGQRHWAAVEYTQYKSKVQYKDPVKYKDLGLRPLYNFTHFLFQKTLTDDPALPAGYIVVKSDQSLALGPKMEKHDYRDLLWDYWYYLIFVIIMLLLIIIIPFFAVCYCCFCCCRRCHRGCPPCDYKRNASQRYLCGLLLFVLIGILVFGTLIAFLANRSVDDGFSKSGYMVRRVAEDTCSFLKDINDHVHHLFAYNYEEMFNHVQDLLLNADSHIFVDLGDSSEANAIEELDRILNNIPEALRIMTQVSSLVKELRFLNYQLRDGVRGVKRDVTYACATANNDNCTTFIRRSLIEAMDTMKCMHIDQLPQSQKYLDGMKKIINEHRDQIPKNALLRMQDIKSKISNQMNKVGPPIIMDLKKGRDKFLDEANKVRNVVKSAVSDIHFNTARKSRSLQDIYEKFASDRHLVNIVVCVFLAVIIFFLVISLICGCLFSKSAAANCLLVVIILIFGVFSFMALVGLFYFILGLLTYQGGCASMQDQQKANLYRDLDAKMDSLVTSNENDGGDQMVTQPVTIINPIRQCRPDESIFNVLSDNKKYNLDELKQINLVLDDEEIKFADIEDEFKQMFILTHEEKQKLTIVKSGNLSTYHSVLYTTYLCKALTPVTLPNMAEKIEDLSNAMFVEWGGYWYARIALYDASRMLKLYQKEFASKIFNIQDQLKQKLGQIDNLILYNNNNFGDSIRILLEAAMRSEAFITTRGKYFVDELVTNLTNHVGEQVDKYTDMVIKSCNTKVGRCKPLTYIYNRGVDIICNHLIDPINGYWFGLLLCVIIFLPILFVAHRLMCLYKTYVPFVRTSRQTRHNCPICTGVPYVAPPIMTCTGGQQIYKNAARPTGGKNEGSFTISIDQLRNESYVLEEKDSQTCIEKRKKE